MKKIIVLLTLLITLPTLADPVRCVCSQYVISAKGTDGEDSILDIRATTVWQTGERELEDTDSCGPTISGPGTPTLFNCQLVKELKGKLVPVSR